MLLLVDTHVSPHSCLSRNEDSKHTHFVLYETVMYSSRTDIAGVHAYPKKTPTNSRRLLVNLG